MSAHLFPSACCKNFGKIALCYIDESTNTDAPLETLASLCEAANDPERIEPEVVTGIGAEIRRYLDQRRLIEAAFFDRTLLHWQIDDPATICELKRLRAAAKRISE